MASKQKNYGTVYLLTNMNKILSILVLVTFAFAGCVEEEPYVEEIPACYYTNQGSGSQSGVVGCENIVVSVQGSGGLTLSGICCFAAITVHSSGGFFGSSLEIKEAEVNVQGAGLTYIWVTDVLKVNIIGSGSVFYKGDPQIFLNKQGSGNLIKQ